MQRLLYYNQLLNTINNANGSAEIAASYCVGWDVIAIPNNSGSGATPVINRAADIAVIELAQAIDFDVSFYVAVDASTAVVGQTIAAIRATYGPAVSGILLYNCNYGTYPSAVVMTRALQLALYNDIQLQGYAAIFLCNDLRDLIESFEDATYNPSGQALPVLPSDVVVLTVPVSGTPAPVDPMVYQYLLSAAYRFNRNLSLGTLYQFADGSDYATLGPQLAQYWYNVSSFYQDAMFGYGVADNFSQLSENVLNINTLTSGYASPNNLRYTRIANSLVQREDGIQIAYNGADITTGVLTNV